ncbi:hypothetical protein B0H16DRAFT_1734588 [Mycena metata]|uniref:Uncharacterized protein n=1 Tax=Mycena metata TaxID=1033252 RepID=A0AAD7HUI4_9AGAR|nr:hypothetical protein B0H16DRAFT_1734588 [Mycena metata]
MLRHIQSVHPRFWDDNEHAPINLSPQFALNLAISREEMIARGVLIGSSAAPLASTLRRQPRPQAPLGSHILVLPVSHFPFPQYCVRLQDSLKTLKASKFSTIQVSKPFTQTKGHKLSSHPPPASKPNVVASRSLLRQDPEIDAGPPSKYLQIPTCKSDFRQTLGLEFMGTRGHCYKVATNGYQVLAWGYQGLHMGVLDYGATPDTESAVARVFASASLPNVTALSIPDSLHGIFPAFPNLTTFACPSMFFDSPAIEPAKIHFPEALIGLRFINDDNHKTLAEDFPHLRVLAVASILQPSRVFSCFRAFKNLTELSLFDGSVTLPLGELITGGRDVLRASYARGPKLLRVWKDDSEAGSRLIHFERC